MSSIHYGRACIVHGLLVSSKDFMGPIWYKSPQALSSMRKKELEINGDMARMIMLDE